MQESLGSGWGGLYLIVWVKEGGVLNFGCSLLHPSVLSNIEVLCVMAKPAKGQLPEIMLYLTDASDTLDEVLNKGKA